MYKVIPATCNNGNLILSEKLSDEWEGKSFKFILVETDEIEVKKQRFFEFVDQHSLILPDDYEFSRDQLYTQYKKQQFQDLDSISDQEAADIKAEFYDQDLAYSEGILNDYLYQFQQEDEN